MSDDIKTLPTDESVEQYLATITDPAQQQDSRQLMQLMQAATGQPPVMWGPSIVGFGTLHYTYASGREGDTMLVGFSARKQSLVLYGLLYSDQNAEKAARLGTHKQGKGCLYIKQLSDVNIAVLTDMVKTACAAPRLGV